MNHDRIVILGGGFGGIKTALLLAKKLKKQTVDIILINRNSYQVYTPSLYEVATAYRGGGLSLRDQDFKGEVGSVIAFDLAHIFSKTQVQVVVDEVAQIDVENQKVHLKKDGAMEYTYCVVALGSQTAYFGVEGAEQHSAALKNLHDAYAVRDAVRNAVHATQTTQKPVTIAVVGAGLAGFELATEITTYTKHLLQSHSVASDKVHIVLIEAQDEALAACSNEMCHKAHERLMKMGIDLRTNTRITKVEPRKLTFSDNSSMEVAVAVWSGGVQCLYLKDMIQGNIAFSPTGQIMVTEFLNTEEYTHMFAVGDCAFFKDTPDTAYAAEQQAVYVAKNIDRLLKNKPLVAYKPKNTHFVVSSAGGKYALADTFVFCYGFLGWLIKRFIDFKYLVSIYPFGTALKMWYKGVKLFSQND